MLTGMELTVRRVRARLTQWKIAAALGYSGPWLSNIERGVIQPDADTVDDITRAIDELASQQDGR